MKKYIFGFLVLFSTNMGWGFSTTFRMGLLAPATGQLDYPTQFDTMFHIIDSSSAIQAQPNTFTSSNTFAGSASTVTINQSLNLSYVGVGQCLAETANGVAGQSCGGGGTSTLGVFNGTSGAPGVAVSSPTGGLNMDSNTMLVTLQGPSTAFVTIKPSSVTLQGNAFNGNSQLVQTDSTGHIPTAVIGTGVILSTGALQSGATFYTSSGTAVNMNSSTNTVQTLLQVNGTGLAGSQVVGQIAGSALNVTAAGNVGLGTAIPGFALDEQQGTANFAFGLNSSTATVSTATITGQIVFKDGTSQNTAPVTGAANLGVSSGSATNSVIVTSPTLNIVLDSTTLKTSLQGSATAFISVNFKGGGLVNTLLATDANGVVISTTVSGSGGGPTLVATQTWSGSNNWTTPAVSTFTYGLKAGSMTINNLSNTLLAVDASGVVISTTSIINPGTGGNLAYYATTGSKISDSGVSSTAPTFTGTVSAVTVSHTQSTNQMSFTGGGGGNQIRTVSVSPTTTVGEVITVPDVSASASVILSTGAQSLNGVMTFTAPPAIIGITDGSNASTGYVGQIASATYSGVSITASQWGDGVSLVLSTGAWMVTHAGLIAAGATTSGSWSIGVSTNSGNSATGLTVGDNYFIENLIANTDSSGDVPAFSMNLTATTTVYAKLNNGTAGSAPFFYGRISAFRYR